MNCVEAIGERLKRADLNVSQYDVHEAAKIFPFIDASFAPAGQQSAKSTLQQPSAGEASTRSQHRNRPYEDTSTGTFALHRGIKRRRQTAPYFIK